MNTITSHDLWVLAQTIWGEARGEGVEGMQAVCHVVCNRQRLHPTWRGRSIVAICQAPWQFSCWNLSDPNSPKLKKLNLSDAAFRLALQVAINGLADIEPDLTHGATHYYADTLGTAPSWARGHTPSAHIGHHLFFAGIA